MISKEDYAACIDYMRYYLNIGKEKPEDVTDALMRRFGIMMEPEKEILVPALSPGGWRWEYEPANELWVILDRTGNVIGRVKREVDAIFIAGMYDTAVAAYDVASRIGQTVAANPERKLTRIQLKQAAPIVSWKRLTEALKNSGATGL